MGLKGAMIWGVPPEDKPYYSELYDPFWAAAQETKMPLSLHVITQRDQKGRNRDRDKKPGEQREENNHILSGGIKMLARTMQPIYQVQRTLSSFIFGKVFEALSAAAGGIGRERHRMDRAFHVSQRSLLREVRDDARGYQAQDAAVGLCAAQYLGNVPGRRDRSD